jgi:pantoate--beta-alanine ligase
VEVLDAPNFGATLDSRDIQMLVESCPQQTLQHVSAARQRGLLTGCVPTMGALHQGHVSLLQRAGSECGYVTATIFVNPTQFGPQEDFSKYPRTLQSDLQLCEQAGVDLVFTPQTDQMYAADAETVVQVGRLTTLLEGAHRPGHFDGVTTVVAKLLMITQPHKAYFGQKDYQQQLVVRRMVRDLNIPVEIVTCPIIRESDGLAMSSRNRYLTAEERQTATALSGALRLAERLCSQSGAVPSVVEQQMQQMLLQTPGLDLQYAVLADPDTLQPLPERVPSGTSCVALIAARVGTTRLIDNLLLVFG